ncbi:MAG: hypothetical protein H6581_00410 [Bacteroidia bacterium]|nr:hypothetical protein [Bacteroidia bacterium]
MRKYSHLLALVFFVPLLAMACKGQQATRTTASNTPTPDTIEMTAQAKQLEEKLLERSFGPYFYYPPYEATLSNIWNSQSGPAVLQELIRSDEAATLARLIACETLYATDLLYLQEAGVDHVAEIYCKALSEDVTGMANSWGLLWENDDLGPQGKRLRMCAQSANPFLLPLLDDDRVRTNYQGSEEATLGNLAGYRVKDFAAFYLSKINRIPLEYHREVAERDAAIEVLREKVKKLGE